MAQQFPDVLGIRTTDPMLVSFGVPPLVTAEQSILDQAQDETVSVKVAGVTTSTDGAIEAKVELESRVGHKFPSGVGFRRAFLEFQVQDPIGNTLWASGRTNNVGLLVDAGGNPIAGELWWKSDCSGYLHPEEPVHQPHYQTITRQDQAQIYQELVVAPAGSVRGDHCSGEPGSNTRPQPYRDDRLSPRCARGRCRRG